MGLQDWQKCPHTTYETSGQGYVFTYCPKAAHSFIQPSFIKHLLCAGLLLGTGRAGVSRADQEACPRELTFYHAETLDPTSGPGGSLQQ